MATDEAWIHHYTSESCEGSKEQVEPCESAPKRLKMQQSAGKVLASVFWDAHRIIFIHCLEKGKTITVRRKISEVILLNFRSKLGHMDKLKNVLNFQHTDFARYYI